MTHDKQKPLSDRYLRLRKESLEENKDKPRRTLKEILESVRQSKIQTEEPVK